MLDQNTTDIKNAAKEAAGTIRDAAREAIKVLADATSEALKVTNAKSSDDHDLLIKISTQMERLNMDVNEIKMGTSGKIDEHEKRIKILETFQAENNGCKNEKKYTVEWIFAALMFLVTAVNVYFTSKK